MSGKILQAVTSLAVFLGLSAALVAVTTGTKSRSPAAGAQEHTPEHEECECDGDAEPAGAHDEHDHDDEPLGEHVTLEELRQIECEHDTAIIECDECRYEVGVVKMNPLLAKGLVEAQRVATEYRIDDRLRLTGEVELDLTGVVEISSAGSGRIQEIRHILGDRVQVSDVLAVVQSAEVGRAQADFLEARAKRDLTRQTHEREARLFEQKISSEADFLVARQQLAAAEATVSATRKRLELFGLSDAQIEAFAEADAPGEFGRLVLTAPVGGTIIEQNVVRGQLVDPTDALFRIADLTRVWVWCHVYESDIAALHEQLASGSPVEAEVHAKAFPGETFKGSVDMVEPRLDRDTRTLRVRLTVPNPQGKLKTGMFVTVLLGGRRGEPVVHLPETALLSDEGTRFVFVKLEEEFWLRRDVTVGSTGNGDVEVLAGLNEGDIVATRGAFMFKSEVLKEKMGAGCAH
ncbi:MAG: efflux RND transporter periplasmic adaptor subunit [Sedimentisphaerales bacterium]|nr:efflux RND transporter periplasmic adaptor subunit [Sedimentisphaerales bacterium]